MFKWHPWTAAIDSAVIVNAATLGPVGTKTKAPGTWGSLIGLVWTLLLFLSLSPAAYLLFWLLTAYLGVAFCGEAEKRMYRHDPPEVVLDEMLAMPICFFGLYPWMAPGWSLVILAVGFGLFRFFDIVKPLGIRRLQKLEGGLGVMLDDIAAAMATCLVLHIALNLIAPGGL